jgi:hypothetical protein
VTEPERYRFSVAMITPWTNIGAPNPRIKCVIGPYRIRTNLRSSGRRARWLSRLRQVRSGNLRGTGRSRTSSPSINWWRTERPQPYLLPPSLGAVDNSPLAAEGSQLLSRAIVLGLTELFIHPRIISVLNRSTSLLSMKGSKLWRLKRK